MSDFPLHFFFTVLRDAENFTLQLLLHEQSIVHMREILAVHVLPVKASQDSAREIYSSYQSLN